MFTNRDEHLSSHMTTLLRTGGLILNVNSSCTPFDKQLGQLHDCSQTTMTGISIGDNRTKVIDVLDLRALFLGCGDSFFTLFPVVEKLCEE